MYEMCIYNIYKYRYINVYFRDKHRQKMYAVNCYIHAQRTHVKNPKINQVSKSLSQATTTYAGSSPLPMLGLRRSQSGSVLVEILLEGFHGLPVWCHRNMSLELHVYIRE